MPEQETHTHTLNVCIIYLYIQNKKFGREDIASMTKLDPTQPYGVIQLQTSDI